MAGIQTPEEAAKLRELEASLDFLKERKVEEEEKTAKANAKVESDPQNPLLAAPKGDNKEETIQKVSEMSALDRARASRFAPPKHILEKAGGIKPIENNPESDVSKKEDTDKSDTPKTASSNSRVAVAPAITPPKQVARPQTMVAAPKPVSPKPIPPEPALKPAMTVEEAQRQGIIAPGTYGKKDYNNNDLVKGDTKEIPNLGEITDIASAVAPKEPPKTEKVSEPIKNPLPIPKKHESKEMDFDHHIANLDMHFDVVDMSGMDFFDIN